MDKISALNRYLSLEFADPTECTKTPPSSITAIAIKEHDLVIKKFACSMGQGLTTLNLAYGFTGPRQALIGAGKKQAVCSRRDPVQSAA